MDLSSIMKTMSPWQFTAFRILFGTYLFVHFVHLAPWAGEIFGSSGVLKDARLNPTHGLFPNPLNLPVPDFMLTLMILAMALLSALFTGGVYRKTAAVLLWFGWTALFHRNNLIVNPSTPYVGLLLLLSLLIPRGEPWSYGQSQQAWHMPKWVFRSVWILMAVGYSFSGFTKLFSPSWIDGSAMQHLLENPLARPGWIRDAMLGLPDIVLAVMTWSTLVAELLFLPLALWRRGRPWIWLLLVLLHLGIIAVIDFADLSFGMLMIHFFTFDPEWLKPKYRQLLIVRFDGDCLMCSWMIRFLAEEDRGNLLRFTPLPVDGSGPPESIEVETDGKTFHRSSAVLALLDALGGHWGLLGTLGKCLPRSIGDAVYRWVARHRYHWFGKGDACAIPSDALRHRIL